MKKNRLNISVRAIRWTGISVCVVFSLAFATVVGFNCFKYSEAEKQFKQKQAHFIKLEKDAQNLKELLKGYREERERFSKLLFSDRDIATFLEEFGDFAKKAEVKIVDMKVRKFQNVRVTEVVEEVSPRFKRDVSKENQQDAISLSSMPINVVTEGNFEHIFNFLIFLETYRQLLTLSDVSIKCLKYPLLECAFTLRLYGLKTAGEIEKQ